ncbi:NADPH-dependent FMN reductase [Streptomyces regalis]|uniref:NADPH-dependent FMN reductase n=1 Tax=Streptomyces regalis TaxID=68262 RepID=A0A117MR18_9ACTN|nr:NAD(P)H-dependent oxidoreductase [Streptomyces regalis]KUL31151.1 NADPH-dependent FMN reductase [Streptomyces regalis]
MSNEPLRLAVIVSSMREGRFGPVVGEWFAGQARERGDLTVDVIDLADHELPAALSHNPSPEVAEALSKVSPRLAEADAFVVVTPEYNRSFPASLKHLIDWHYTQWRAKPVGFVSYGGLSGGLRAVEQLRPVYAEMHAVTVRDVVSFHTAWERFGEDGNPVDETGPAGAAKVLLDQLAWWGTVLREGRTKRPYQA